MTYSEGAKIIEAEEIKELIDEKYSNPTVERLMFIEAKSKDGGPTKTFPCFVEAWGEEENAEMKVDPGTTFMICIVQSMNGEFGMVRVYVKANELGVTKRIWDKPPTKNLREETPWVVLEGTVQ